MLSRVKIVDCVTDPLNPSAIEAGFPFNATYTTHPRNLRNKRNWPNGCSPQPRPLLGRLLLQFNAAQENEL